MPQVEAQLVVQANLPALVAPIAISPDGKLAALGNRIWDLESGMRLYEFRAEKVQTTICRAQGCLSQTASFVGTDNKTIGFSPDNRYFVIAQLGCTETSGAAVWDLQTGKLLTQEWRSTGGEPPTAKGFPFTEDDACRWSGRDSWKLIRGTNQSVFASANGKLEAKEVTQGNEKRLIVQRTADASEVWSRPLPAKWFGSPVFSPDGRYFVYQYNEIVETQYNFFTAVEDLQTKKEVARFVTDNGNMASRFSPGQRFLCLSSSHDRLLVVDTSTWKSIREFKIEIPSKQSVYGPEGISFAFGPDGNWILDATGVRRDLNTGESRRVLKAASVTPVNSIAVSKNQDSLAAAMYSGPNFMEGKGTVVAWSLKTNVPPTQLSTKEPAYAIAFTPDGKLITGTEARDMDGKGHELHRGAVSLWDISTQQLVRSFAGPNKLGDDLTSSARLLAVSAGGKHLAAASRDIREFQECGETPCGFEDIQYIGLLHVWDLDTGAIQLSKRIKEDTIAGLAISPKGQNIATVTGTGVTLWNLPQRRATWETEIFLTPNPETGFLDGYEGRIVQPVVFSMDGNYLAVGDAMGPVSVWHLPTKDPVFTAQDPADSGSWVSALAFSADSTVLYVGACDGSLKAFSVSKWEQAASIQAHDNCISDIVVGENADWLASASLDGTTRLWSLPQMQPLATLLFDAMGGKWLVVAPDGTYDASEHGTELAGWRIGSHIVPLGLDLGKRKPGLLPQIFMKAGLRVGLMCPPL